jgi:hypothetical protein
VQSTDNGTASTTGITFMGKRNLRNVANPIGYCRKARLPFGCGDFFEIVMGSHHGL